MKRIICISIICLFSNLTTAQSVFPPLGISGQFNIAPPEVYGNGLLGFHNPAMSNFINGHQSIIGYSSSQGWRHMGIFTGIKHLSFGTIHTAKRSKINDKYNMASSCQAALGFGSRQLAVGMGIGWSAGNSQMHSDDYISTGLLWRPSAHLSIGGSTKFSLQHNRAQHRYAAGLRPWEKTAFTLFTQYSPDNDNTESSSNWTIGAAGDPIPGLTLSLQWAGEENFRLACRVQLKNMGFSGILPLSQDASRVSLCLHTGDAGSNNIDRHFRQQSDYLSLEIEGQVVYRRPRWGGGRIKTLTGILHSLNDALNDSGVAGVAIRLSGIGPSAELAWEIRRKLDELKAKGKRIIIFIDRPGMAGFHLASVADKLILDPDGLIMMQGYAMSRTYIKDMLDKLGIGFEEWRFFPWKSAFENYARNGMSEADRIQRQAWLDDLHQLFVKYVADGRQMTTSNIDSLIQTQGIFLAREAAEIGLVDTLARWSSLSNIITDVEKVPKRLISKNELHKRNTCRSDWGARPKIAIVYAEGSCATDEGINARSLEKQIRTVAVDPSVKAVVLRVDSPGGDGMATDWVAQSIRECKKLKPVVVSQGRVAASGGYWLSMDADTIVAGPSTLTGSIGVIGAWMWNKGLANHIGLKTDKVKTGRHADLLHGYRLPILGLPLPERNLTPEEKDLMEIRIRTMYREFVAKVAAGRGLSVDSVRALGGGRIWSGRAAKANGLVDVLGGLDDAIRIAKSMAGIKSTDRVQWLEIPTSPWFDLSRFMPRLYGIKIQAAEPLELQMLRMFTESGGQPMAILPSAYWSALEL